MVAQNKLFFFLQKQVSLEKSGMEYATWSVKHCKRLSSCSIMGPIMGCFFFQKNIWPSPGASLVAQMVKNLLVMQEIWVHSLGWDDLLEEGMATHSSILSQGIPWTQEFGGLQSMGVTKELGMTEKPTQFSLLWTLQIAFCQ